MSAVEINETLLKQYHFLSSRKNKIRVIRETDSMQELQKRAISPTDATIVHNFDKRPSPIYGEFETLLVRFFRFSYCLGMIPYYWKAVELENGLRTMKRYSNKFHLAIVIPMHVCTILRYMLRFYLLSYNLKNPFNFFKIARAVLSTSLCSFFLWSLWRRYAVCKELLNRIASLTYFPNMTKMRRKSVQYPILFIAIALLCMTSVYRSVEECKGRWEDICNSSILTGHEFCNDSNDKYQSWQIVVKVLIGLFNYLGRTTRRLPRLYLLVIALTMWQICKSFAKSLRLRNQHHNHYQTHEIVTVLRAYEELKAISNLARDLVGEMLVSEIVEDIVYFSLEVQLRLRESDWFSIFVVFETWMVAFMAYFVAACAADHIQEVSIWLARDDVLSQLSPGKVITLHTQLYSNPIGMKGGSLFTLTKTFLANVVTVWVTYFVILLQFQVGVGDTVDT